MAVSSLALVSIEDQIFIDKMIHKRLGHAGALLGILGDVQAYHPHKYLPLDALRYIALKTEITFSKIYSVAAFALQIRLVDPRGRILDQISTD